MFRYRFVLPTLCWGLLYVVHSLRLADVAAGQQRLFSPSDVPVSVVKAQTQVSVVSTDIKSCLSSASSASKAPFKVRFQKLKGNSATFTRTLLDQGMITTNASKKKTVSSTDIANCVSLAETGGFVGFSFNDGTCDLFNMRPQLSGCVSEGKDVFYVQDSYWAPGGRPGGFSLSLTRGLASIFAKWEPCCPTTPRTAAKFQLSWNNKMIALNKTTFQYNLKDVSLCTDNFSRVAAVLRDVTLQAFDDAGTLMKTATATLTERTVLPGRRHLLKSSNCLYYERKDGATFQKLDEFCKTNLYSTMFIEYVDGDYLTYIADMKALANSTPPVDISFHYVGVRNMDGKGNGTWIWQSGLPQPIDDSPVWDRKPYYAFLCGESVPGYKYKLLGQNCGDTLCSWVCHDYSR